MLKGKRGQEGIGYLIAIVIGVVIVVAIVYSLTDGFRTLGFFKGDAYENIKNGCIAKQCSSGNSCTLSSLSEKEVRALCVKFSASDKAAVCNDVDSIKVNEQLLLIKADLGGCETLDACKTKVEIACLKLS